MTTKKMSLLFSINTTSKNEKKLLSRITPRVHDGNIVIPANASKIVNNNENFPVRILKLYRHAADTFNENLTKMHPAQRSVDLEHCRHPISILVYMMT